MSVSNYQIDLRAIEYAIDYYADDIPFDLQNQLLSAIINCHNNPRSLIRLMNESETLDRLYEKALTQLRLQDVHQERTKAYILTAETNGYTSITSDISQFLNTIAQLLTQRQKQSFTTAKETILKKLSSTHLRTQDLSFVLNHPLDRTQTIIQQLWKTGYIDRLDSSILYILFPNLRPATYRNHPPTPDLFLTLTTKGYFHLYPLIQWAKRGDH